MLIATKQKLDEIITNFFKKNIRYECFFNGTYL